MLEVAVKRYQTSAAGLLVLSPSAQELSAGYGTTGVAPILFVTKVLVTPPEAGHAGGVLNVNTWAPAQLSLAGCAHNPGAQIQASNIGKIVFIFTLDYLFKL